MRSRGALLAGVVYLLPAAAQAHPGEGALAGLGAGFQHPLLGWDHLLAMLAVGIWTAQQRRRGAWLIPLGFAAVMSAGGAVGAYGVAVPAVEPLIALSVLVLGALIGVRARPAPLVAAGLVGFFAFFHGAAHGSEIPPSASLVSFGVGFCGATLLLQGLGWLLARLLALATGLAGSTALGQAPEPPPPAPAGKAVEKIVVHGRADSLVGVAHSATQGVVGAEQLSLRPLLRAGEMLETIPGLILTQHAGGGKANQLFLRGFNLDHGTDFATRVEGMPINLPSHGHGQGYTDLNGLIPELVQRIEYRKGPYYAEVGDFASAGSADLQFFDRLEHGLVRIEGGRFGHRRLVAASSGELESGALLGGLELAQHDGPWEKGDDFERIAGLIRYTRGGDEARLRITALGHRGEWNSSDQIARSAADRIGRFASLDDTTGGKSQRYAMIAEWQARGEQAATRLVGYAAHHDLDLFSNFTYFLADEVRGDQFEQVDRRWTTGLAASHSWSAELARRVVTATVGLGARNDSIRNGLFPTHRRSRIATSGEDRIEQSSAGPYAQAEVQWLDHLRSVAGVRLDWFRFAVDDRLDAASGAEDDVIASPKLSLVLGPFGATELYAQAGLGFHSNDARGVNAPLDRADPLVRTWGMELGLRTTWLPGLHGSAALWQLDLDSEIVFVGDAGTTEASRPSRRHGIELASYYTPTEWLTLDLDVSLSRARFRDDAIEGDEVPGSVERVVAAGISVHELGPLHASLRLRHFGPRPLHESGDVRSGSTTLLSAALGWRLDERWSLEVQAFNLLDREESDIEYFYESRTAPGAAPREEIHFHPVEPFAVRAGVVARF